MFGGGRLVYARLTKSLAASHDFANMSGYFRQLAEGAGDLALPRTYLLLGRHHAADARGGERTLVKFVGASNHAHLTHIRSCRKLL